ncbi:MAG: hypothetical protein PVS2B3_00650 [Steroidobacteraceae bacterium]
MNARHTFLALVAMTCAALGSGGAWGNKLPGDVVAGTVTSVAGNQSVNIQGHNYPIQPGSPAARAAAALRPGQVVDVTLNGPASSPSSRAINIVPRSSR